MFSFSSSTSNLSSLANQPGSDDPHLEVIVTPSSSAFYAGETFSATITFRNTRPPPVTRDSISAARSSVDLGGSQHVGNTRPNRVGLPVQRRGQIGLTLPKLKNRDSGSDIEHSEAGPSRRSPLFISTGQGQTLRQGDGGYGYSPTGVYGEGSPTRSHPKNIRSPETFDRYPGVGGPGASGSGKPGEHGQAGGSAALGKAMSPQEMVWALGRGAPTPPPLPTRRNPSHTIPTHHPHSRKVSITTQITSPPPSATSLTSDLSPILESSGAEGNVRRPLSHRVTSSSSSRSTTSSTNSYDDQNVIDLNDDDLTPSISRPKAHHRVPTQRVISPSASSQTSISSSTRNISTTSNQAPSYTNAYGAAPSPSGFRSPTTPPPPTHPYMRSKHVEPRATTTILWAYTRLVAHFHPTNAYIPPDPLLPLRSMMLQGPVGSGSLTNLSSYAEAGNTSSSTSGKPPAGGGGWQMSFGTGTIGNATTPSFTGSLFGLAKDLVYGGSGGSLEEERKRVWNMKDLPVLETSRSLLGVDVRLKEGEERQYTYTIQLPSTLPPAHRGKAFRFSYDLVVSLSVALPGVGKRQKTKDIDIPIRVWANVSLGNPLRTYDILKPVIQTTDEGKVIDTTTLPHNSTQKPSSSKSIEPRKSSPGDTKQSLETYARHLLDTLSTPDSGPPNSPKPPPLSPSKHPKMNNRLVSPKSPILKSRSSGSGSRSSSPVKGGGGGVGALGSIRLDVPNGSGSGGGLRRVDSKSSLDTIRRGRKGSFLVGDDELIEEAQEDGGSGEAVEVLSRHSAKASFDIAKDGDTVAVVTLIKTTYRLGETVSGVVTFNSPDSDRRVVKLCASLESHELIPENLLPLSASSSGRSRQPPLNRLHAEQRSSYTNHSTQIPFSLDIPSDATPAFSLAAGKDGFPGGLEWRVKMIFLVSIPGKHARHKRTASGASASSLGHKKSMSFSGNNTFGGGGSVKEREVSGIGMGTHLLPMKEGGTRDLDNKVWMASTSLAPVMVMEGSKRKSASANVIAGGSQDTKVGASGAVGMGTVMIYEDMQLETVECEIPVRVLAGNTAFVVRPSTFTV